MAMTHKDLFGKTIQEKWIALEKEMVSTQAALDEQYKGLSDEEAQAASEDVTKEALKRAEELFKELKALEAEMEQKIKDKQ